MTIEWVVIAVVVGLVSLALTLHAKIYARGEKDRATAAVAEGAAAKAEANRLSHGELEGRVRNLEMTTVKIPEFEKSVDKLEGRFGKLDDKVQGVSVQIEVLKQTVMQAVERGRAA